MTTMIPWHGGSETLYESMTTPPGVKNKESKRNVSAYMRLSESLDDEARANMIDVGINHRKISWGS